MERPALELVSLFLFIIVSSTYSQPYIGDLCNLEATNEIGQWHLIENCLSIKQDLSQGILPKTCGFHGSKPIVCCAVFSDQTVTESYVIESDSILQSNEKLEIGIRSKQKCRQFAKYGMEQNSLLPNDKNATCSLASAPYSNPLNPTFTAKDSAHVAIIGYNGKANQKKWRCLGSLISDQFVLTSAHCLFDKLYGESKYIKIGDFNLQVHDTARVAKFNIIERFQHPDYYTSSSYNDIGLLKMDRLANLNAHVRPACLGTDLTIAIKRAIAIDWRKTDNAVSHTNIVESAANLVLQKACNDSYHNFSDKLQYGVIKKSQICSDGAERYLETCEDDFSGLLQVPTRDVPCTYSIIGIKSLSNGCGTGVYTRVSKYIDWIDGIVWP